MAHSQSFLPPPGSFGWVQAILTQRGKLAPEDITLLMKRNLSSDQIEAIVAALRPKSKPGRPPTHSLAQLDFDSDFQAMLAEILVRLKELTDAHNKRRSEARAAGIVLPKAEKTPAEEMWEDLHARYGPKLKMGGVRNLRNAVSRYLNAKWELPEGPIEHEELEAIWESRQSQGNFRECNDCPHRLQRVGKPEEDAK